MKDVNMRDPGRSEGAGSPEPHATRRPQAPSERHSVTRASGRTGSALWLTALDASICRFWTEKFLAEPQRVL